jgi:hypothetical protein
LKDCGAFIFKGPAVKGEFFLDLNSHFIVIPVLLHGSDGAQSKNLNIKIYRTIILPVVLYGRETWSLTLKEERRLRVFEIRVLRREFGPLWDDVTGMEKIT